MKSNDIGNYQLRRGNFYTFIKKTSSQISYPQKDILEKFVEILNALCHTYMGISEIIEDPRQVMYVEYEQFNITKFEDILKTIIRGGHYKKIPENWLNTPIHLVARYLIDEANQLVNEFLLQDNFRPGSVFLDIGDKSNLLISCGDKSLFKIPVQKQTIKQYLAENYSDEIAENDYPKSLQSKSKFSEADEGLLMNVLKDYVKIVDKNELSERLTKEAKYLLSNLIST